MPGKSSGLKSMIGDIVGASPKFVRRIGILGELVNATAVNLFAITGGDIICTIHGKITAVMDANATTVQLRHTPTGGAAGVTCLASGALNGQVVNTMLNPTGAVGVAIAISAVPGVGVYQAVQQSLCAGIIDILVGGATQVTGIIEWTISYMPLNDSVSVVAV